MPSIERIWLVREERRLSTSQLLLGTPRLVLVTRDRDMAREARLDAPAARAGETVTRVMECGWALVEDRQCWILQTGCELRLQEP